MTESPNEKTRLPRRAYVVGGIAGIALVLTSYGVMWHRMGVLGLVLLGGSVLVLCAWMLEGLHWHAEQRRLREERVRADERARALQQEAQEAGRRAAAQVNARRTVSHGGMTISVHRKHAEEGSRRDGGEAS